MSRLSTLGNDLHTGRRSFPIVQRYRTWLLAAAVLVLVSVLLVAVKGLNAGIEFRGGSQFTVTGTSRLEVEPAREVVDTVGEGEAARVTTVGAESVRVQTQELTAEETTAVREGLAEAYDVPVEDVTSSFVGPTWGQDITRQAVQGLVIFLLLVSAVLSLYFRSWRMAASAMVALLNDLVLTVGVYALVGWEVTPATVIGLLTILGYSLYDTVVVFDKIRENTQGLDEQDDRTYSEAANLAVNQTLVRSINTSLTSILPVGSILFVGALLLGAGTLRDIALALFVGMIVSTLSSVFVAAPLQAALQERDARTRAHTAAVLERRAARAARGDGAGTGARTGRGTSARTASAASTATAEPDAAEEAVVPGRHQGRAAQPRRKKTRR
ncbi:protein translocase subunit SecF [Georgenia faecalis]|uniref:protein translocase subunit SecF n=1 Tax=Georgenia faecalis TaxID=2483799 RepID=UPI000F085CB1|nr:protein translocase subunit SecF [Georgenia faecalis]